MPHKIIYIVLSVVLFSHKLSAQGATQGHRDSLNALVNQYHELNITVFQKNSNLQDIDNIFALFTEDFTYVHPKYGGTYSREDLYNGYVRNQKNGGYDGSVIDIEVTNRIVGLNSVAVEKSFIEKTDTETEKGLPKMTLFEFKEGKILRIYEYW